MYSVLRGFAEALDILNESTLDQNTPSKVRAKRDADEELTNDERRVAGVRRGKTKSIVHCILQCRAGIIKNADNITSRIVEFYEISRRFDK